MEFEQKFSPDKEAVRMDMERMIKDRDIYREILKEAEFEGGKEA